MKRVLEIYKIVWHYDIAIAKNIKYGVVTKSQVPSFAVDDFSRSSTHKSNDDYFDVMVRYSYLEGTLLPYGIGMKSGSSDVVLGTIPYPQM